MQPVNFFGTRFWFWNLYKNKNRVCIKREKSEQPPLEGYIQNNMFIMYHFTQLKSSTVPYHLIKKKSGLPIPVNPKPTRFYYYLNLQQVRVFLYRSYSLLYSVLFLCLIFLYRKTNPGIPFRYLPSVLSQPRTNLQFR